MRKIKVMIASMFGAIALVFACVFGTRINAASTQPYVNADFSAISQDKDGNSVSTAFSDTKTISVNNFDIILAGGGGSMQSAQSNGLKMNKATNTVSFTTLDVAKITIVLYIDKSTGEKEMSVSNNEATNPISITGLKQNSSISETTLNEDYKYSVTNSNSGKDISINVFSSPTTTYTISNNKDKTVYLKSIRIQPYATVSYVMNGGTAISSKTALYGDTYTPETPAAREGYSFVGWYTNDGLTDEYDNTVALTDDLTLYAKWADANAVYNVTFMNGNVQYGDSISIPYDSNEEATIGALMPTNPTKVGYEFVGWYTKDGSNDDWGTKISDDTTIDGTMVSNNSLTLYSKFNALATCVYSFGSGTISSTKQVVISDSITLKEVNKFGTDRTNTFNGNSMVNYCQCSEIDFVLSGKASVEIYITQTNATNNVSNYGYYIKDSSNNIIANSGYTPVQKPNKNVTVSTYQTIVLPAGSYKLLSPLGVLNIYGMKIDYTTAASATDMTPVKFEWQFDDDINPTKVRFIGTLNGIEDLSKLSNMKVAMTIRNSYVDSDSKTQNVGYAGEISFTGVYKKVLGSGDTSKETAVDGVYYTVCTLTGIDEMTYPTTHEWTASWTIEAKLQYTYNGVDYSIQSSTIKGF